MNQRALLLDRLLTLLACRPAFEWVSENGFYLIEQAWEACSDPNWMLWLVYQTAREDYAVVVQKVMDEIFETNPYDLSPAALQDAAACRALYDRGALFPETRAMFIRSHGTETLAFCFYKLLERQGPVGASFLFDNFLSKRSAKDRAATADMIRRAFPAVSVQKAWSAFWSQYLLRSLR